MAQPIDKAFSVLKNLAPDEYYDLVESGHITPEMQSQMYSEAAHGSSKPHFPESAPMPNQQELLQTAMEKLKNPIYRKNMELILNKPLGEKMARHSLLAFQNEVDPESVPDHMVMGKDVPEDTY